ncbi:MAG: hypothetical protein OEM24_13090, partial [Paracoccaceae bacterium]|nr:hypothetical protein [Paracoccaceae bacterium]
WMATNYRQIFVTHKGDLDSVAKYTLRMIDWWTNVNLNEAELRELGAEVPELAAVAGDFDRLKALASSIRNAESAALKEAAIDAVGGSDAALAELRGLNELMMVAGQRKHLAQASEALTRILQADAAERSPDERAARPLTLEDILARARGEREGGGPQADFERVIDAFANGYANLPEEAAKTMAADIAGGVERALAEAEGAGQIDAATRVALLPVLRDGAMRARAVGTDMQADAAGLAGFAEIARSDLGEAVNRHLADLGEPDLNLYLLNLQRGGVRRRVARLLPGELDGSGWPRIQEVDEIARPADVAADLRRIMWLGEKLGWSDQDFARRMAAYFNGPDYRQALAEGEVGEATRSYADDAMEAYLAFARLFDRSASTTRFVTFTGPDGEEVTVQIEGSRFADAEIHLGYLVFQNTLRGAEGAARLWGIKGDIESIATFGRTLHSLAVASADMDEAARAKAFATIAAEAYGGFTGLAEKFASKEWQETLERHIGKESLLIGKSGGTITAMLSTADDLMQSREAQEAVFGAMAKDLLILWNPHVATVLAVHAMYKAGETYFVNQAAKNDFLDLLVRNGEWVFADDGTPPVLERVIMNNVWYDDDAEARKNQCLSRAANAMPPEGTSYRAIGLEHLVKTPPASLAGGAPLCKLGEQGCVPEPDRVVKPREAILTLFFASPQATTDPVLLAAKDAIDDRVGWEYLDAVRRVLTWDDGSKWTAERLASHGIYPPTPEDGSGIVREPVRLDEAGSLAEAPRDVDRQWVHSGIWTALSAGGRRMLGYSSSEYWVRRQYIIECVMLDPLIKEAGRRAQKESFTGVEAPEIRDRLAELDARVRALDGRVWPNIAASADPYRP